MKLDHRISIKILGGLDNDFLLGLQIKEAGSLQNAPAKNPSVAQRMSIFFKGEDNSAQKAPEANQKRQSVFQKRFSIFSKIASPPNAGSLLEPEKSDIPLLKESAALLDAKLNKRQSISHITRQSMFRGNNYINIAASIQVKAENMGKEFEFILNDSFHSVFLYIYKRKFGSDQLFADLEIPMICLDPDECWHEDSWAFKDETYTDKKGHQFVISSIQNPVPCYTCKIIMLSDPTLPELEFFKCEGCGILCHEKCHTSILTTCSNVINVKLAYKYTKEEIFEPSKYIPFKDCFFNIDTGLLQMFARVCENLEEAALHINKIFETLPKRKTIDLIAYLCMNEITIAESYHNIFQEPSLAVKVLEFYMKANANDFVIFTLQRSISQIINDNFDCELDSNRILREKRSPHITEKLSYLENYLEQIFRAITTSPKSCPFPLRCIISKVYDYATKIFPQEPTIGYLVSNAILFRKFFIPAILGPDTFGMQVGPVPSNAQRTLTILSKILHRIANLDFFDSNSDLNFQKMNRLIGSYHPIISIYINEIRKVNMATAESQNLPEENPTEKSTKIVSIPWYKKLFPFCFPQNVGSKSASNLDLFKRKDEQILDWEDLDVSIEELAGKKVDAEIHIAALGRMLITLGDKLILACQNDRENQLAYEALRWATAFRGNHQKADEFRQLGIRRIQQDYLQQFYAEEDDCIKEEEQLGSTEDFAKSMDSQTHSSALELETISESNESFSAKQSPSVNNSARMSWLPRTNNRQSAYQVAVPSSLKKESKIGHVMETLISSNDSDLQVQKDLKDHENLKKEKSDEIIQSSPIAIVVLDTEAVTNEDEQILDTSTYSLSMGQYDQSINNQKLEQIIETPTIMIAIESDDVENPGMDQDVSSSKKSNDSTPNDSNSPIIGKYDLQIPDNIHQKRKSLQMNLDTILRPQVIQNPSSGPESPRLSISTKKPDFKSLLPQFGLKSQALDQSSESRIETPKSELRRSRQTPQRDETGSFIIQKNTG